MPQIPPPWQVLQRLEPILECKPDVIILMIGTNDALGSFDVNSGLGYKRNNKLPEVPTFDKYKEYLDISEIILFDGKGYEKSIGFDHSLLNDLPSTFNKMIAGDIKIENILKFKDKDFIIDISGSLENNEGKKDLEKINRLLNLVKDI